MSKELTGPETIAHIKNKAKQIKQEKKDTQMKNFLNKIKTPLIVLATLAVVAALYALHVWSYDLGVKSQKAITAEISQQVASKTSK